MQISGKTWIAAIAVFLIIIIGLGAFIATQFSPKTESTPQASPSISPTPSKTFASPIYTPELPTALISPSIPPSALPSATLTNPTNSSTIPSSSPIQSSSSPPLPRPPIFSPAPTPIVLYPGEVREYQGQPLDPIGDVYPNAIAGIQYINQTSYVLTVNGLVNKSIQYTYDEVVAHQSYEKVVTIFCVEGWDATILWQGILLKDLLNETGAVPDAKVVIFRASDGYSTALPLDYIVQNDIILAYKMNGVPLLPQTGWPFMLVAQSQYGYKWIKWITSIEVSNDANYLGYWETRGYPNNATIS